MAFVYFMVSPAGRLLRVVAGVALIAVGLLAVKDLGGILVAVIGLIPLLAGALDFCLFAPLFGASLYGEKNRRQQAAR